MLSSSSTPVPDPSHTTISSSTNTSRSTPTPRSTPSPTNSVDAAESDQQILSITHWYADSAASRTVTDIDDEIEDLEAVDILRFSLADKGNPNANTYTSNSAGWVEKSTSSSTSFRFHCHYVPGLGKSLISVGALDRLGYTVVFGGEVSGVEGQNTTGCWGFGSQQFVPDGFWAYMLTQRNEY